MTIPPGARAAIQRAAAELAAVPAFSHLAPIDRARLAAALQEVTYPAGQVIFAQGSQPDGLYILRQGLVQRQADGVTLDLIQPPAVFGDLALLRRQERAATLIAVSPCVVWRLPADRFSRMLTRLPSIAEFFAAEVSSRLASRQTEIAELSQEFQSLAEELYVRLDPDAQQVLDLLALLPELDQRVVRALLDRAGLAVAVPDKLPLADVLLERGNGEATQQQRYPPALRRLLIGRLLARLGPAGLANRRREVAAVACAEGAPRLAIQVLLEGELLAESVELAEREIERLMRDGRVEDARELVRLLPSEVLAERSHLHELAELGATPIEEAVSARRRRLGRRGIGIVAGAVILVVLWVLGTPPGLSLRGWHALVALLACLPLLAVESLPDGIVALLLACIWVVGGVVPPALALSGFASPQWMLVVSVLAMGVGIASSGLLYRLALWTVAHSRGGFVGQVVGLAVAGMLIGPGVPNATSRVTLVAPAVSELVDAAGYQPRSPAAVGLSMAVLIGFGQVVALFLTSSTSAVLVYAVLPEASRASVDWLGWFLRALPTHIIFVGGMAAFIVWHYAPRRSAAPTAEHGRDSHAALALQQALLGPLSRNELIALSVTILTLIGFATQPFHHVDPAWVGIMALAVLAASGVVGASSLASVNWSFALLFGILTSMSPVFSDTQLDKWLASLATEVLGAESSTPVLFIAGLCLLCFLASFVLRYQAAAPLLTISLSPVAASAGIDPWIVGLVCLIACNGFFLPYQSTSYLALYSGTQGRLFAHGQARPMAVAYAVMAVIALCASVPVWRLMGLLS